jgi:hypothetical protein
LWYITAVVVEVNGRRYRNGRRLAQFSVAGAGTFGGLGLANTHRANRDLPVESYHKSVEFFYHLLKMRTADKSSQDQ